MSAALPTRFSAHLLACALLVAVPGITLAQRIIIPVATIPTPQLVAPASNATLLGTAPSLTSTTFVWRESGLFSYGTVRLPTYFIVCLRRANEMQICSWANANWSSAAGSIPHSTYSAGMPFGNPLGYQYSFVPPTNVPDTYLDQAVNWIVGACASPDPTVACVNSTPQALWFTAQDYVGENTGARPLSNAIRLRANGRNAGTTTPAASTASFSVYQVLLNATNQCRTDANSADVVNDGTVRAIMANGEIKTLAQLPRTAGLIDTTNIIGLNRTTLYYGAQAINMNPGLAPNTIPTQLLEWDVPTPTRPMGFASILNMDANNTIREQNESNNVNVECNVAQ